MTPFLTDQELSAMTTPLIQPGARRRYLDKLGVPYLIRPDGQPLVSRGVLTTLLSGIALTGPNPDPAPNFAAARRAPRKVRHG